jgi:hypothetical protein
MGELLVFLAVQKLIYETLLNALFIVSWKLPSIKPMWQGYFQKLNGQNVHVTRKLVLQGKIYK